MLKLFPLRRNTVSKATSTKITCWRSSVKVFMTPRTWPTEDNRRHIHHLKTTRNETSNKLAGHLGVTGVRKQFNFVLHWGQRYRPSYRLPYYTNPNRQDLLGVRYVKFPTAVSRLRSSVMRRRTDWPLGNGIFEKQFASTFKPWRAKWHVPPESFACPSNTAWHYRG